MSFVSSHQTATQETQKENILVQAETHPKDIKMNFSYSQNNQTRQFGKEITNLVRVNSQNTKAIETKLQSQALPNVSKLTPTTLPSITPDPIQSDSLPNIKPVRHNSTKVRVRTQSVSIKSHAAAKSAIRLESKMEMEPEKVECSPIIEKIEEVPLEACDVRELGNPQYVPEYAATIFKYLRENEKYIPQYGYMTNQSDINEKMRAILVDWLVDVHIRFKLLDETLFLTINIIDRYIEKCEINRQKLQLIGITAMLIASKYEEIYAPEIKDFVYITDKAFTKEEILEMEGNMLAVLGFNLTTTSSFRFLQRYSAVHGMDERTYELARYLTELSLLEYRMLKYTPSNVAASSLYLACKILKRTAWDECLQRNAQYTEQEVRPCAKDLCVMLQNAPKASLQAVRKKFSHPKHMEISKIQLDRQ